MKTNVPTLVKWAGGKKQLLPQFKSYFPKPINKYFDPFVGGGAVAFYILKYYKPKEALISDSNEELINVYKAVKNNVEELIRLLKDYKNKHSKEFYYKMRAINPNSLTDLERAGRFIYLNKTCFNGLYRVNSKGEFNVPIGSYKNPAICQEKDLREISKLLKNVEIEAKQFYKIEKDVEAGDFVYFDPPYYPLKKDSFTTYTKESFLDNEQIQLADLYKKLDKKGAKLMLSNSDADFIKNLYKNYVIKKVRASRMINCDAKGRGKINEVVITNYDTKGSQKRLSNKEKLTIGIDIDGVLADTISRFLQEAESKFGIKAIKKNVIKYDFWDLFNISRKEFIDLFKVVWNDPDTLRLEDKDIPSILDNLHETFNIYITTSAVGSEEKIALWLKKNKISYYKILHFSGHNEKHTAPEVDIYIDDDGRVIENVIKNNKIGILLRQPWNDEFITKNKKLKMMVADNWREIEQILLTGFD